MASFPTQHVPVMPAELVHWLNLRKGDIAVDCTLGGGGHTQLLAEQVGPNGLVIGIDRDPAAVDAAAARLRGLPIKVVASNYSDLPEILQQLEINTVQAIVLDLGLSSDQLADANRGFSFASDGPLDLRFNTNEGKPAWKLLERLGAKDLADMIYAYGEERHSRRIARRIVEQRHHQPIRTARELADLVRSCVPRGRGTIDPATRTFQALRIAVNDELKWLEVSLARLPGCLQTGGRIAAISFHSLEDRLVKTAFAGDGRLKVLTPKPIRPGEAEIASNPRARSAKLRAAERTDIQQ